MASCSALRPLRVASTAFGHDYDRSLYGPLRGRVIEHDPLVPLEDIDLYHVHWPEYLAFDDAAAHQAIIGGLNDRAIPIVWTSHNLTPHVKNAAFDLVYGLWARGAAAVIHHSHWGERMMRARYRFGPNTEHVVLPHGHFGHLWQDVRRLDRRAIESELGFGPCALRIGILGRPRVEKRVVEFMDGFASSTRRDMQLAVWCLAPDQRAPDDDRIVAAEVYRRVDSSVYARRLAACDLLALPFDPDGDMLSTGLVADAVGVGIPVLATSWGYLNESLGAGAIPCGVKPSEVTACLNALTEEQVSRARAACCARQPVYDWGRIADATFEVFERIVRTR